MKTAVKLIFAAALAAASVPSGANAAGLLGNVVNGVLGGTGSGGLVNGLLGGTNSGGSGSVGVPGVVTVQTGSSGGDTHAGITLLGGGGNNISSNLGGLLGNGGGLNVNLPNLGGALGGGDGGNGSDGTNGTNGGSGGNGSNGYPNVYYVSTGGPGYGGGAGLGASFGATDGMSARLRLLLKILADRDWLQYSNGQAVCLNGFGTAQVSGWLPNKDWPVLQRALANYSQDIGTLRRQLANCHNPGLNQASLKRVIGLDIRKDGSPVLFVL